MKFQITLNILMQLLAKRRVTAKQIADRYEISRRSVYRYVEELTVAGVPVDCERGRYGGFRLADTYRLPAGFLSADEYAAAINALTAMNGQVQDKSVQSALEKLQGQQRSEKRELSVCGNILVDGGVWGGSDAYSEKMSVCERAVNEQASLKIDYISRTGEHSKRVIDPHLLIFKQNVWYVYAFCHNRQKMLTFKIGRIKHASFTGETFKRREFRREDIDLDFYYEKAKLVDVTLEIEKNSLPLAEEWLGIDNIEPRGKAFIAEMTLPDDGMLASKILSYGGAIKVLAPEELKLKVMAAAKKISEWL